MFRFVRKAVGLVVPAGLVFYGIKPIFNKENVEEILQMPTVTPITIPEIIPNTQPQQTQKQTTQEPTNNQNQQQKQQQPQQHQSQPQSQQPQAQQPQQQPQSQQPQVQQQPQQPQPQPLPQQQSPQQYQQYAQISPETPKFLQNLLQMHGIKVLTKSTAPSGTILIKNKAGDKALFNIGQGQGQGEDQSYLVYRIGNFLRPVWVIQSQEEVLDVFKRLPQDQYLIVAYLPTEEDYNKLKQPKSMLDSFTPSHRIDIKKLQQAFRNQKYQSGSSKNSFAIIRNPQLAKSMKINTNKIGNEYLYYKTTPNQGMETSTLLSGIKYTIKSMPICGEKNPIPSNLHSLINQINFQGDVHNFLRSLHLSPNPKKLLVLYSKQRRPQFLSQIKSITLKASKMLKQQVTILMTDNPKILTQFFQIVPDDFVTVRLLDVRKYQEPLVSIGGFKGKEGNEGGRFYSRRVMNGAYNVENLCKFVRGFEQSEEYYEKKRISSIPSIVSVQQQVPNNTVVLHWKHGCKACQLTQSYLQQLSTLLPTPTPSQILTYQIPTPSLLPLLNLRKYNILNQHQNPSQKDHDVTPKLILHTNGRKKDLGIGEVLGRIGAIGVGKDEGEERDMEVKEVEVHQGIVREILERVLRGVEEEEERGREE